jgi:hypothetical protein
MYDVLTIKQFDVYGGDEARMALVCERQDLHADDAEWNDSEMRAPVVLYKQKRQGNTWTATDFTEQDLEEFLVDVTNS